MSSKEWLELLPIPVGHGNYVIPYRVLSILNAGSLPIRRMREEARASGRLIDATEGRKTRAVIVFNTGHVLLSSHSVETLTERWASVLKQKPLL
jgi:regulator of extracellular matrix RemA (YlzA/DUF370 family)